MLKLFSFCTLFLFMTIGLTHADNYRCKDADGTQIFTDDPSSFPPECQIKVIKDLPLINVVPSVPFPSVSPREAILPPASTNGEESLEKVERSYGSLKEEAENLVKIFLSTRSKLFRSHKAQIKYKARNELTEIRSKKGLLLNDIDQSTLSRSQKKEVREILASIT